MFSHTYRAWVVSNDGPAGQEGPDPPRDRLHVIDRDGWGGEVAHGYGLLLADLAALQRTLGTLPAVHGRQDGQGGQGGQGRVGPPADPVR